MGQPDAGTCSPHQTGAECAARLETGQHWPSVPAPAMCTGCSEALETLLSTLGCRVERNDTAGGPSYDLQATGGPHRDSSSTAALTASAR